jgi:hypothetical protein
LDKNARLGESVIIHSFPRGTEMDCGNWFVRDGIVIIPKDAEIAAGTVLAPKAFSVNKISVQNVTSPALLFTHATKQRVSNDILSPKL